MCVNNLAFLLLLDAENRYICTAYFILGRLFLDWVTSDSIEVNHSPAYWVIVIDYHVWIWGIRKQRGL